MATSFGSRGFILSVKRCHYGHQKVRSLSAACRTHSVSVQTWKDTEWDASHGMEEIREFCFKEFAAVCLFWNFFVSGFPVILLITPKRDMLIAAVPFL